MLTDAEIAEIAQGLLDRSLPPPRWTHQAHFAAAVWLLRHGGDFDMAAIIRDYNAATGTPNTDSSGYHHSITFASLAAARAALKASPAAPLADVLAGLMAGPLLSVQVGMGEQILILTFVVVVIGGLGSLRGAILGAIGVSGAPGGDADDACAKAGIAAIHDKIDF